MFRFVLSLSVLVLSFAASAQVTVKDAWVRATVAQQKATGAFMQLLSEIGRASCRERVSSPV